MCVCVWGGGGGWRGGGGEISTFSLKKMQKGTEERRVGKECRCGGARDN